MIHLYKTDQIEKTGFGKLKIFTCHDPAPERPKWSYPGDYEFKENFSFDRDKPMGEWIWINADNWRAMVYIGHKVFYTTLIGGMEILNLSDPR